MTSILSASQMSKIEAIIEKHLLKAGADHVVIVDMSGNLVLEKGSFRMDDILSLAVLSAANFAATAEIAKLIGEEEFTLLFHKGDNKNIHFSRLGRSHIMITLFDENISLGLIRLKSAKAIEQLAPLLNEPEGRHRGLYRPK